VEVFVNDQTLATATYATELIYHFVNNVNKSSDEV
jgi:hypothetical protein